MTSQVPIHIDGTNLEGGGQLLRLSLSLSSLTGIPFRITDIRGKRGSKKNSGEAGGMKQAHLAAAKWLAQATHASTDGLEVKSRELLFRPEVKQHAGPLAVEMLLGSVWRDVVEDGKIVRRESHISLSTPGSIFLILQAILPFILFSPSSCATSCSAVKSEARAVPLRLTIEGGTNVWHSLSYEYADQVLFPMLHKHVGIGPIGMTLNQRGWSTGRADVGSVTFDFSPLTPARSLPVFSFTDRGKLTKIYASILAPLAETRDMIQEVVISKIQTRFPDVEIVFPVLEETKVISRLYLLLVAETSNGFRFGRDWLAEGKIKEAMLPKIIKTRMVSQVVTDLVAELEHGGCVDEFLQDQLVVFQVLAEGKSRVEGGNPSLHTLTARWVASEILGVGFKSENCHGIGIRAGDTHWPVIPITKE